MRRVRVITALALTTALLAACGGEDADTTPSAEPSASEVTEAPAEPETWPLTGLPVEKGVAAKKHPVLVVKIDNTSSASPQLGLGKADMVVEELVEGGTTRLAAFFYTALPEVAGPVRSMRASDIGIVSPVDADVVTSGAAPVTIGRIKGAGIRFFGEGSPGLFRESSRYAPYNLMARPGEVARAASGKAARPDDYFTFGDAADLPKGKKASSLSAGFGRHTTSWQFANGRYTNAGSYAAQGDEFVADSVLVLRVQVVDAGYKDPAGSFVPESRFTGTGEAMLFHGGRVVTGKWSKSDLEAPLELSAKGEELAVPTGRTWVELVPVGTGSVGFQK